MYRGGGVTQKSEKKQDAMASEHAMNEVLSAEEAARRDVQNCASEAESLLQQARESARRILQRADSRVARVRHHASQALADAIRELERKPAATVATPGRQSPDREASETATDEVATLLTTLSAGEDNASA